MAVKPRPSRRLSLSKKQLQGGIGAELFTLCKGMTADGALTKAEILALRDWLRENRDADIEGVAFLSETLSRIIADGVVSADEQRDLL
ncbi:MAG: hypothetical protein SGJ09_16375 [Phycisphaerae bacterium]|nr:hypothetical protein [Phycisphaerae bacterium]